jgi:hypothetical protein
MDQASQSQLIRDLRERLSLMERSHRPVRESTFSTGIDGLDQLLPGRGLEWGTLVECLSDREGSGAATLALAVAAHVLKRRGVFVVIDGPNGLGELGEPSDFYPPAAASLGIPLEQTVIVQPANARAALWALEQALRSSAVGVALGRIERLNGREFRRLQLAAETGGSLGFLLRPVVFRREPTWAEVRLLVQAVSHPGFLQASGRRLHVELLHGRGGAGGGAIELELSDEAGLVRLVSRLGHPASSERAAGA